MAEIFRFRSDEWTILETSVGAPGWGQLRGAPVGPGRD